MRDFNSTQSSDPRRHFAQHQHRPVVTKPAEGFDGGCPRSAACNRKNGRQKTC